MHIKNLLWKTVWVIFAFKKENAILGIVSPQGSVYTLWLILEDGEVWCVCQGILGENSQ